jgi:hypothetical protein
MNAGCALEEQLFHESHACHKRPWPQVDRILRSLSFAFEGFVWSTNRRAVRLRPAALRARKRGSEHCFHCSLVVGGRDPGCRSAAGRSDGRLDNGTRVTNRTKRGHVSGGTSPLQDGGEEGSAHVALCGSRRAGRAIDERAKDMREGAVGLTAGSSRTGPPAWQPCTQCEFFHVGPGKARPLGVNAIEPASFEPVTLTGIFAVTAATKETGMALEAMTFAQESYYEILDHKLTDEYAAALAALERGDPEARSRVLAAYEHLRARSTDRLQRT